MACVADPLHGGERRVRSRTLLSPKLTHYRSGGSEPIGGSAPTPSGWRTECRTQDHERSKEGTRRGCATELRARQEQRARRRSGRPSPLRPSIHGSARGVQKLDRGPEGRHRRSGLQQCRAMIRSLLYLFLRRVLGLASSNDRIAAEAELEIAVLRHQVAILRRQVKRPIYRASDKAFLAAASRLLRRRLGARSWSGPRPSSAGTGSW